MKKVLFITILFAMVFAFDGCSQNPSQTQDMNQEIDELNSIIESQNDEINDLYEQNDGLSAEISQLITQIEEHEIAVYEEPLSGQ